MSQLDAEVREKSLKRLAEQGFRIREPLPVGPREEARKLREPAEIARRLWALDCLFGYVAASTRAIPTMRICKCMLRSDLRSFLTPDELSVIDGWRSKARRRHMDTIGWRLENMWPLAWMLGFDLEPTVTGGMLEGEPVRALVNEFLGSLGQNVSSWMTHHTLRHEHEVIEKEDLFYCAHRAVLLAREGSDVLPVGLDSIAGAGVIEERLRALSWALSPGVAWEAIELSPSGGSAASAADTESSGQA